jgi:hypothetical protein
MPHARVANGSVPLRSNQFGTPFFSREVDMNMGKLLLVPALLAFPVLPALGAPEPPPCGSPKDRPPAPAPSDDGADDAGLAPPPQLPPVEPGRPVQDGTGTQDPDKQIK